eukprot:50000-Chlamydomonas_euryale.AAC.1
MTWDEDVGEAWMCGTNGVAAEAQSMQASMTHQFHPTLPQTHSPPHTVPCTHAPCPHTSCACARAPRRADARRDGQLGHERRPPLRAAVLAAAGASGGGPGDGVAGRADQGECEVLMGLHGWKRV